MAKYGEFNGQLAEALRVLDRPADSDKPTLAKALALARRSGVFHPDEFQERFSGSAYFDVNPESGRVSVKDRGKPDEASWILSAKMVAASLLPSTVTFDDRWQPWRMPHTPNRSRSGIESELRQKSNVANKVAMVALQPSITHATVALTEHTGGKSDPFTSANNAMASLEVSAAQRSLTMRKYEAFRENLTPEYDQILYEGYTDGETSLVRAKRFMGSYTRQASVGNRDKGALLLTTQSLNMMQQTTYALEPEWGALLLNEEYIEGFRRLEDDAAHDVGAFIAEQEVVMPMLSSLHVQQRHEIMQTRPF